MKLDELYSGLVADLACSHATNKLSALMKSKLKEKLGEIARALIDAEFNNLYRILMEKGPNSKVKSKVKYSDLSPHYEDERRCGEDDRARRNFIAHAGLLKDYTYIEPCGDDYCLDFDDEVIKCLG
jgi:CRISPR/Cas system-associated protein Csx1